MVALRRAGLALAVFALAAGHAQDARADRDGGMHQASVQPELTVGVLSELDLSIAHPAALARAPKPSYLDRPCSFVPAKNPVKPKKNACRFV